MKLLQHKTICTQTVQTPPRLLHCVTDTDRRCIAGEKRCPPPALEAKTTKHKLNLRSTSTVKRSNKQQSKINSNHQLNCLHKLEKFYRITNTSLKVYQNAVFTLETLSAKTTGKVSDVWVYQLMTFQFLCCTETLWTFTTNVRLHTFMSLYVYLKVTTDAEFLLTNVTSEPSAFIVWLQ